MTEEFLEQRSSGDRRTRKATTPLMKNMRKKAAAIIAGLALTGLAGASAASLGDIKTEGLGAAADDVTSCDTDGVTVAYETSYDATAAAVQVDTVTISNVAALCDGKTFDVVLFDGDGATLGSKSGTVALTTGAFDVDMSAESPIIDAEDVEGIAITISGNDNEA